MIPNGGSATTWTDTDAGRYGRFEVGHDATGPLFVTAFLPSDPHPFELAVGWAARADLDLADRLVRLAVEAAGAAGRAPRELRALAYGDRRVQRSLPIAGVAGTAWLPFLEELVSDAIDNGPGAPALRAGVLDGSGDDPVTSAWLRPGLPPEMARRLPYGSASFASAAAFDDAVAEQLALLVAGSAVANLAPLPVLAALMEIGRSAARRSTFTASA
jgi:hypothetical protein